MNTQKKTMNLSQYRAALEPWNLVGKTIATIKAANIDLTHNDKVKANNLLRLVAPIKQVEIITIDIFSAEVVQGPEGQGMFMELNRDPNLQFKIVAPEFVEVSLDNVNRALKANEEKMEPLFFSDLQKLTSQVTRLNNLNKQAAESLAEEALAWAEGLKAINKIQNDVCEEYYESLGLNNE